MHSPAGWDFGDLVHSFGELWMGQMGIWFLAYVAVAALICWTITRERPKDPVLSRYSVRHNGLLLPLPLRDILWISAAGNYTEIHTTKGQYTDRKTLAAVERELAGTNFLRAHRSALVNVEHVAAIKTDKSTGSYTVQLGNGQEAPPSRRRLSDFKSMLQHVP